MEDLKNTKVNNEPGFLSGQMKETAMDLNLYKKNIEDSDNLINNKGVTDVTYDRSERIKELIKQRDELEKQVESLNKDLSDKLDDNVVNRRIANELEKLKAELIKERNKSAVDVERLTRQLESQLEQREKAMTLKEKVWEALKKGLTVSTLLTVIGLTITDIALKIKSAAQSLKSSQGPRGSQGEPGSDGKDGHDGKSGKDGHDGKPGKDGKSFDLKSAIISATKTILSNRGKFVAWILKMLGKAFVFLAKNSIFFIIFVVTAVLGYIMSREQNHKN